MDIFYLCYMRVHLVLMLLLIAASVSFAESVSFANSASLYGEYVVLERDGKIISYDVSRGQEKVVVSGANPSLFGFIVAYESNGKIDFAEIRLGNITNTGAFGNKPFVFANYVVFSAKESALDEDVNADGDKDDDILFEYDMNKKELTNLKAVGSNPVRNAGFLLFLTNENQVDVDLNGDGDKSDSIVRAFDFRTRKVANLKVEANSLSLGKLNSAVAESNGEIIIIDAMSHDVQKTGFKGSSPFIFGRNVVFSQDENLMMFSVDDFSLKNLAIKGERPQLFDAFIIYFDKSGLQVKKAGDLDKDEVGDFVDNCPAHSNINQEDGDRDGLGDVCDSSDDGPKEIPKQSKEQTNSVSSNESSAPSESNSEGGSYWWLWLLLIIPLLPFLIKWASKYHHKRKKSFGF